MSETYDGGISERTSIDGPAYKELVRKYELAFRGKAPSDPDVLAWALEDFDIAHMKEGPRVRTL